MSAIHHYDNSINRRELVSLLIGTLLLALLLLGFMKTSRGTFAHAQNPWFALDLYADHHYGHRVYLPLLKQ